MVELANNKKEDKKTLILHGAKELFIKYGYEKVSLDDIAKYCRMGKASLYYYYSSKEELFGEVIQSAQDELRNEIDKDIKTIDGIESKILRFYELKMEFGIQKAKILGLTVQFIVNLSKSLYNLYKKMADADIQYIKSYIDEAINNNEIEAVDSYKLSRELYRIISATHFVQLYSSDTVYSSEIDLTEYKEGIKYIVSLVFKGIVKK